MYRYADAGLKNVWLANGYKLVETPYGKGVSIQDVPGLTRAICAALVKKPGRTTGAEFRYLRLHLRLSQKSLARMFGNNEQSVANWEKSCRIPMWADKHIRLLWTAQEEGNTTVKRLVQRMNEVERIVNQRMVLEDTRSGWKSRLEDGVRA